MKGNALEYEMQTQPFILWLTAMVCQDKMEGFTVASFIQAKKNKTFLNPTRTPAAPYMPGQSRARMD